MRKPLLGAVCTAVLICGTTAAQDLRPFSFDDLVQLDRVSDPQISPDGRFVVFTVRETDLSANKGRTDLWLMDLGAQQSEPRRLTQHEANDSSARWAPDSHTIYFLSTRSGSSQVWRLSLSGGEAMQVTRLPLDVNALKVSPKADRLVISMEVFPDCADATCSAKRVEANAKAPAHGQIHDRLFVRHWDTWSDGRQSHLFTLALDASGATTGAPVSISGKLDADVPSKPMGGDDEFTFSPDGMRVVFAARIKGKTEPWSTNFDLFEMAADGSGEPRNLTPDNPAWDTEPVFSADGRLLAWRAMERPGFEADRFHLVLRDMKTGGLRHLTQDWDRSIDSFAFTRDGRRILASSDHLGQHALWSIDVKSGKPALYVPDGQVTDFSVGPQRVVYGRATLGAPVDLHSMSVAGGPAEQITRFNAGRLKSRRLAEFEQFSFSGWNGEMVRGYVMKPVGFEPGRKYPVAFIVHGGPQVSYGNAWSYRWNPQVFAGAGYGAVFIDFHGSPGYGQAFTDSISGDWGGKPLKDLQKGLAAALEKYQWLDGERACALGASYGGFMMNWIAGNWPERFRCLVNHDGIFDSRAMYYQTEELWFVEWENGGTQFDRPQNYEQFNPINHLSRWRTPMLVIHGALDYRVPDAQGLATFTALQRRGIESRLLYFPDENHWVLKPQNSLQWHTEVLGWLERWLK